MQGCRHNPSREKFVVCLLYERTRTHTHAHTYTYKTSSYKSVSITGTRRLGPPQQRRTAVYLWCCHAQTHTHTLNTSHTHTHIHAYMHIHMHAYMHTFILDPSFTYIQGSLYPHACNHPRLSAASHTHTSIATRDCNYLCAWSQPQIHTQTKTHVYTWLHSSIHT